MPLRNREVLAPMSCTLPHNFPPCHPHPAAVFSLQRGGWVRCRAPCAWPSAVAAVQVPGAAPRHLATMYQQCTNLRLHIPAFPRNPKHLLLEIATTLHCCSKSSRAARRRQPPACSPGSAWPAQHWPLSCG
mmetsp:Transcript_56948/g.132764  ORF Transcript_56948/g.132764 Transcript_56948/m.132764 type:complete len:131 (-) Transcript_56948:827-1219(-)